MSALTIEPVETMPACAALITPKFNTAAVRTDTRAVRHFEGVMNCISREARRIRDASMVRG